MLCWYFFLVIERCQKRVSTTYWCFMIQWSSPHVLSIKNGQEQIRPDLFNQICIFRSYFPIPGLSNLAMKPGRGWTWDVTSIGGSKPMQFCRSLHEKKHTITQALTISASILCFDSTLWLPKKAIWSMSWDQLPQSRNPFIQPPTRQRPWQH